MPFSGWRFFPPLLIGFLAFGAAWAQQFNPDDEIPSGAKGKVLQLSGVIRDLNGTVRPLAGKILELRGIGASVAGAVTPVAAALEALGAKVEEKQIKIDLAADVLFDFDSADLRPEAGPALEKVGEVLAAYPEAIVLIEGHTDAKGSNSYNQRLSERRAKSVAKWLTRNGAANKMVAKGLGETSPVAPNEKPDGSDDPEGRQENRRVAITVNME